MDGIYVNIFVLITLLFLIIIRALRLIHLGDFQMDIIPLRKFSQLYFSFFHIQLALEFVIFLTSLATSLLSKFILFLSLIIVISDLITLKRKHIITNTMDIYHEIPKLKIIGLAEIFIIFLGAIITFFKTVASQT